MSCLNSCRLTACRPVEELRTVEDIMLREQELAETDAAESDWIQQAKADADAAFMAINSSSVQTDKNIVQANAADSTAQLQS